MEELSAMVMPAILCVEYLFCITRLAHTFHCPRASLIRSCSQQVTPGCPTLTVQQLDDAI